MERKRLIGLILIAAILTVYSYFFGPKPHTSSSSNQASQAGQSGVTLSEKPLAQVAGLPSSWSPISQERPEQEVILENKDIKLTLTSHGGSVKEVLLKNYQDHQGQPLILLDAKSSQMGFQFLANHVDINTSQLQFETADQHQYVQGENPGTVTFTWTLGPNQYIRQVYTLPSQGYELTQHWDIIGLGTYIDQGAISFVWHDLIKRTEQDLQACRNKSTVNYYLADDSFDHLKERSDKEESKTIDSPIKWVGIKQRFFTAGIVADQVFSGGKMVLKPTLSSDSIMKEAQVELSLPNTDDPSVKKGKFVFYFGPNDYHTLKKVAPGFSKNLPLGWPIVKWINQFLILPIFSFIEQYTSNYGLIIFLLVILIKLILLPLSYKSYISMAEMKVLKPALDKLKSQYGNNLQKLQMEQAKLHREMGINPLSGCIPVLLQMPILLAMFNFFPNAIELRQKAFLWAHDLSTYDAIIHLPFKIPAYGSHVSLFTLLMTASTILYTWSNNQVSAPEGPMKTLSYLMPLTFMVVLNSFPAGLSFYYFISNLITFGQQALIKRFVDEDKIKEKLANHKQRGGEGKKGNFKARLQEAIKRTSASK